LLQGAYLKKNARISRIEHVNKDEDLSADGLGVLVRGRHLHAVIETHLGIDIRRDVKAKPVQQLGRILRLLGLRLERFGSNKQEGQKTYRYRLEPKSLASLKAIVQARKA
jgi:hypothetical protein